MNDGIETLTTLLTNKRPFFFILQGKADSNGYYNEELGYSFESLNNKISYYVSLVSFHSDALFPNISPTLKNNIFYYSNDKNEEYGLELYTGAYEIEGYSKVIEQITKDNISFSLDKSTGRTKIDLKNNYKVDFTKEGTFVNQLGFNNQLITTTKYSENIADILITKQIFIYCSLVSGSYFRKKKDQQILYDFPNKYRYGAPIIEIPNPREQRCLNPSIDKFTEINIWFKDQDNKPIDFGGSEFILKIEIRPS
jgi:hypothetical protein